MPPNDDHTQAADAATDLLCDPELRRDPLSHTAVFLAPRRGERPIELGDQQPTNPPHANCPFCRGHERLAPPDVLRLPPGPAWEARVVPNRYPLVNPLSRHPGCPTAAADPSALLTARPAVGVHEVLIESPQHTTRVEDVDRATWQLAWQAASQRLSSLAAQPQLQWAMLFKNAGPQAGASLAHVHSQIVGLDFVPPVIQRKTSILATQPTLHEQVLAEAATEGRIWAEVADVVAFVPAAARQPFESCIMPRAAEPHFHTTPPASLAAIAELTHRYARQLSVLTASADYNWWLHQAAFTEEPPCHGWHWHLEIMPRLTQLAGFELGSGCHITTMSPEQAAALLRGG